MAKLLDIVKPGVVTGEDVQKIFAYAKANNFAIPAVNCVGSDSVNAVLETAARVKAPVIIQFSNGGAAFYAGKGIKPTSGARPDHAALHPLRRGAPLKSRYTRSEEV